MRKERKIYNCTLTPLTPIQVGNGNQIYPYNYVIKNGFYYRIELSEILEKFPDKIKEDFIRLLENNNMIKIRSFIFDNYEEEYGYLYKAEVDKSFEELYYKKIYGTTNKNEENQLTIEEFIGNHSGKFIPGSTIKGAIRGALLFSEFTRSINYTLERNENNKTIPFKLVNIKKNDDAKKSNYKKFEKDESDKREAKLLGLEKSEPKVDPFKNIIVTDTKVDEDLIKIGEIKRISIKKDSTDMPMGSYEITKSNFSDNEEKNLSFSIIINDYDISEDTLNSLLKPKKNNNPDFCLIREKVNIYIEKLFKSLNSKAKRILELDKEFFSKTKRDKEIFICQKLLERLSKLNKNEALIRFGRGAGFNSTTLNLANNSDMVYTRVVSDDCPVGWAIISYNEIK